MNVETIDSIVTNNFDDSKMMSKYENIWKNNQERIASNFSSGHNVYGVYHKYESNYKGNYTFSLCDENLTGNIELSNKTTYKIYPVEKGAKDVPIIWKKIWDEEDSGVLKRAYTFDFEKYSADGLVFIYIAI